MSLGGSLIGKFLLGARLPFRAARLVVTSPRLLLACLIPWALAAAVSYFFIQNAAALAMSALAWAASGLGVSVTGLVATLLQWAFGFLSWVMGALVLVWAAALLTVPFADWISELTEAAASLEPASSTEHSWFSRAQWRRIRLDFYKTLVSLVITFVGLVTATVPVLGLISPVLLALGLSFQFLSYPQTRREEGVARSLFFVLRNFPESLGFGLVCLLGFGVPFFSAFLFPMAVVGGTLLDCQCRKPDL